MKDVEEEENKRKKQQEKEQREKQKKQQNEPEPPKVVCTHDDLGSLSEESQKGYCGPNAYLHEGQCSSCAMKFVEKKQADDEIELNTKNPVWVCRVYSTQSGDCKFALCNKCYVNKLINSPVQHSRRRQ
jgi:hypothetical protein